LKFIYTFLLLPGSTRLGSYAVRLSGSPGKLARVWRVYAYSLQSLAVAPEDTRFRVELE
jgi:hypothetical protein